MTIRLWIECARAAVCAVQNRTLITFPLFDCAGIDTSNLLRLSAKSRGAKPEDGRARSGGVGPHHTIDGPDKQRRAAFGGD